MVIDQGGLPSDDLSSVRSFIRWSLTTSDSVWSVNILLPKVIRLVFNQTVCHQRGLSSDGLSSGWTFIRRSLITVDFHQVVSHHGGFSSGGLSSRWTFVRWSLIGVVFPHQGFPLRTYHSWTATRALTVHAMHAWMHAGTKAKQFSAAER